MGRKQSALQIVLDDRKKLVNTIIDNMEKGYVLTNAKWNHVALNPQNPISCVSYKGGNKLKLMNEVIENGYTDPRWMTAIQIRDAGYKLSGTAKGKGVICEKWIFTKEVKVINPKTGKRESKIVKLDKPKVSFFKVFNAEYVLGIPQFISKKPTDDVLVLADQFINTSECKILEVAQDRAFYNWEKDKIVLPLRESFKDSESFFSITIHELGHSTGHESRLNRKSGMFGDADYAKEELRAEISSLFVCNDIGIANSGEVFQDHSNYLQSWIEILMNDYNELFRACADAEKISDRLLDNYTKKYQLDRTVTCIPKMDRINVKTI